MNSRWLLILVLSAAACDKPQAPTPEDFASRPEVIQDVAAQRGLSEAEARDEVETLLALAAAADASDASGENSTSMPNPARVQQLTRATLARLYLTELFEPSHDAATIPEDDPLLRQALSDPRVAHKEETVEYCQLLVVPHLGDEPIQDEQEAQEAREAMAARPSWQASASTLLTKARTTVTPLLPADSSTETCPALRQLTRFFDNAAPEHQLRFEASGLELGGCLEENADGSCKTPRLDPVWEGKVRVADPGGFIDPFFTSFGLHWVYVSARHPPAPPDDPKVVQAAREKVLRAFRQREFEEQLDRLRRERTVRIAESMTP